jgi:hypothetical protein
MHLQYLTFMGRNLENRKKLKPIWITISVGLNSENIVNSVDLFNGGIVINGNYKE